MPTVTAALRGEPIAVRVAVATLISAPFVWLIWSMLSQVSVAPGSWLGLLLPVVGLALTAAVPVPITLWLRTEYTYVYAVWFVLFSLFKVLEALAR